MTKNFMILVLVGAISVSSLVSGASTARADVKVGNQAQIVDRNAKASEDVWIDSTSVNYTVAGFKLVVSFKNEIKEISVNTNNIHLRNLDIADDITGDAAIKVKLDKNKKDVIITLKEELDQNVEYNLILSGIKDINGNTIADKEFQIRTGEKEDEVLPEDIKAVSSIKGQAISANAIKWTWDYDKAEEKNIEGFVIYDENGELITEYGAINVKEREYIQKGLTPGKNYKVEIAAFRSIDGDIDNTIESDKKSATAKTKSISVVAINEKNFIGKAQGKDIQWYWEAKSYQDYKENYSDYVIRISKDASFKKYSEVPLVKGKFLEKNALEGKSATSKTQVIRYYQVVNKAYNIKSNIGKKIVVFNPSVLPKAPHVVVGEVNSDQGYAILKIKDQSTNEVGFNIYGYDEHKQRYYLGRIDSTSSKRTGDNYAFKLYGFQSGEYAGCTAAAVDQYGTEGKESAIANIVMD
ncbi:MAG: Ig-like domain-containing protein [Clostridium sp.]